MLISTLVLVVTDLFEALAQGGAWETVLETTAFGCTAVWFAPALGKLNNSAWCRKTQTSQRHIDAFLHLQANVLLWLKIGALKGIARVWHGQKLCPYQMR